MEACASAHHWGRTLTRFGHTVRLMASIADPHSIKNGRQVSAWLGLVPRQHSSRSSGNPPNRRAPP
jgi:transposase